LQIKDTVTNSRLWMTVSAKRALLKFLNLVLIEHYNRIYTNKQA